MIETLKCCSKCGVTKPLVEFSRNKASRDGLRPSCRNCDSERKRSRYANDPEYRDAQREHNRDRWANNPLYREGRKRYLREYYADAKNRGLIKERSRKRSRDGMDRKHGMTAAEKRIWLDTVGWRCEICSDAFAEAKNACVDHDHSCCPGKMSCGKCIRGALCNRCNAGIAMFRDNASFLASAITYLAVEQNP